LFLPSSQLQLSLKRTGIEVANFRPSHFSTAVL
jgi:hypothetical protein